MWRSVIGIFDQRVADASQYALGGGAVAAAARHDLATRHCFSDRC
jgi:hypothetical protein